VTKKKNRTQIWIIAIVVAIGLVPIGVLGLFMYVSATTVPLHPTAQDVTSVAAVPPAQRWASAADQARHVVRSAVTEQNLPGVSVAVGAANGIVWAEGFGWANIQNKVPVSPDTRFRIGTASTVLTSAAVGLLLENERLKLDEKIQSYVPEFQGTATLRQVMGHTAGVRSDGGDEGPLFGQTCDRPVEALQHFDHTPRFEAGADYRFSNFSWILVSAAVEAASGEPFLLFMRRQIFEPLGMNHTHAENGDERGADMATSYFPRFGGDPRYGPDPMRPINLSCYAGASTFVSTPSDLVRFSLAISSGQLLQPATVQLLQTTQRLPSGKDTGYGLGWDLETVDVAGKPTAVIGHDGDVLGGTVSSLMLFPEHGVVVAVTSNTSYADTAGLAVKIAEAFVARGKT
jgi:CubicO group peptidase (beta-lactamase class C family)